MYCLSFNLFLQFSLCGLKVLHLPTQSLQICLIFILMISVSALAGMGNSVALDREVANNVSTSTN